MTWNVPLSDLQFDDAELQAVQSVVTSKWLTMGACSQQFEQEFAAFCGAKYAFGVTNCTAGLHLACLAAGIGPGDEVIVPSLSFVATANAVRYVGAVPVFADICSQQDLTISPASIEASITPKTKAIMVMHYAGYPCDMPAIQAIADRHHLIILEDAAHAAGTYLDGRHMGTWGLVGAFSFFSNKNLAVGEGGMVLTDDPQAAEKLRLLRSHGMTSLTWDRHKGHAFSYDVVELGYNYRIDEIRSAMGIAQLHKLAQGNQRRRDIAQQYRSALQEAVPQITIPFETHPGISSGHIFPILLPRGMNRQVFMEKMKAEGIQTSIHYPPIHLFQAHRSNEPLDLGITEEIASREVTLPLYPSLSDEQINAVVCAVVKSVA